MTRISAAALAGLMCVSLTSATEAHVPLAPDPVSLALMSPSPALLAPSNAGAASAPAGSELGRGRGIVLLKSLAVPGWGQRSLGHPGAALVFGALETTVWASFVSFEIQNRFRTDSYERTARIFAGIDLSGRNEEWRRRVGAFLSSDEYNRLVIYREAANLYYDNPTAYRAYIATHQLSGNDTWNWASIDAVLRYDGQRKQAQRAVLRANAALGFAVANRIISTLYSARASRVATRGRTSWRLEAEPDMARGPEAFRVMLCRRF